VTRILGVNSVGVQNERLVPGTRGGGRWGWPSVAEGS
jgi:hypothetical protein